MLRVTEAVIALSDALIRERALPASAQNDAIHIAVPAVHGVDYLLTWNFRHLANAESRPLIREVCERQGYKVPRYALQASSWEAPKMFDEIIEELWRAKEDIAREHGNDVRKLASYLQGGNLRERSSGSPGRYEVDILDDAPGERLFKTEDVGSQPP